MAIALETADCRLHRMLYFFSFSVIFSLRAAKLINLNLNLNQSLNPVLLNSDRCFGLLGMLN